MTFTRGSCAVEAQFGFEQLREPVARLQGRGGVDEGNLPASQRNHFMQYSVF